MRGAGTAQAPSRFNSAAALLVAVALPLLTAVFPLDTNDIWFHLAAGRWILDHRTIPHADVFSFTARGEPWVVHEWLWEVVAWTLWSGLGAGGIVALRLVQLEGALAAAWVGARLKAEAWAATLATVAMALALSCRVTDRPQLLSAAAFATTLLLLELHRSGRVRPLRLAGLPLFGIWANCHAGVVFGLALILYEAAWAAWERDRGRARELLIILALAGGLSVLATPGGLDILQYPFKLLRKNEYIDLVEYQPLGHFLSDAYFWPTAVAIGMALVSSLVELRRHPRQAIRTGVLLGVAVWHVRGVDVAGLSAVPLVAASLERFHVSRSRWRTAAGLAAVVALEIFWVTKVPTRHTGRGLESNETPTAAVRFVEEHHLEGWGYNSYLLGGYLLFAEPERPVFIDGRTDVYYTLLYQLRQGLDPFSRWPITYAVVSQHDALLWSRPRLPLAWFDDRYEVDAAGHPELELHCLLPEGPFFAQGVKWSTCVHEVQRVARESPESWRAQILASAVLLQLGHDAPAEDALRYAASLPEAPTREVLVHMRALALSLAAPDSERVVRLRSIAASSPDASGVAVAELASGDCSAWETALKQYPQLGVWASDPRSPVRALVAQSCSPEHAPAGGSGP